MPRQNVQRFNEPVLAPDFLRLDGQSVGGGGATPTGTATSTDAEVTVAETPAAVQKVTFTFNVTDGDWLNANDTITHNMGSFNRRCLILSCVGNLTLTKKGSFLLFATDIDLGVGIVQSTDSVMSGNEDIIVEKLDFNEDTLSLSMTWASMAQTVRYGGFIAAADDPLWLNMYGNVGADSTYDLTGTVDFFVIDLG